MMYLSNRLKIICNDCKLIEKNIDAFLDVFIQKEKASAQH